MRNKIAGTTREAGGAVIDEAAARNASIGLRSLGSDGRPVTARARILGAEEDRLLLDHPQSKGRPVVFAPGQALDVRLHLNDAWYSFKSHMVDISRLVRLNAMKKVVGAVISRPRNVQVVSQRRNHFRVRLFGEEPVVRDLHDAARDGSGVCPIDARRFQAELVDLSVGGAGIRVSKEWAHEFSVGELLFLTFALPDEDREYSFLVEVRRRSSMPDAGEERMGLQILDWPSRRDVQRSQQRLQRYLTNVQRNRLRRTR